MADRDLNWAINSAPRADSEGDPATDMELDDSEIERTYDAVIRDQREQVRLRQRGYERRYRQQQRILRDEGRVEVVALMEQECDDARRSVSALVDLHERHLVAHPITFRMQVLTLEENIAQMVDRHTQTLNRGRDDRWPNALIGRIRDVVCDLGALQQRLDSLHAVYSP